MYITAQNAPEICFQVPNINIPPASSPVDALARYGRSRILKRIVKGHPQIILLIRPIPRVQLAKHYS